MGSIFSPPKPPPPPSIVEEEAPEDQEREDRLEMLRRRRRGRAGTVSTSFRGILSQETMANSASNSVDKLGD